jgi:hypothetical protein
MEMQMTEHVYVVSQNDFVAAVFRRRAQAAAFVARQAAHTESGRPIYWTIEKFELQEAR